jgi:hypothetical protein
MIITLAMRTNYKTTVFHLEKITTVNCIPIVLWTGVDDVITDATVDATGAVVVGLVQSEQDLLQNVFIPSMAHTSCPDARNV